MLKHSFPETSNSIQQWLQNSYMFDSFAYNFYFLKNKNLNQAYFNNLNFFENSRLWVFKKYFYTNQQDYTSTLDMLTCSRPKLHNNNLINSTTLSLTIYNKFINLFHANYNLNFFSTFPSFQYKNDKVSFSKKYLTKELVKLNDNYLKNNVYLSLQSTDLISGVNISFLFMLTSNPKDTSNQINSFIIFNFNDNFKINNPVNIYYKP